MDLIEKITSTPIIYAKLHFVIIVICDFVVLPLSYFILIDINIAEGIAGLLEVSLLVTGVIVFGVGHFIWLLNAIDYPKDHNPRLFLDFDTRQKKWFLLRSFCLLLLALLYFLPMYIILSALLLMSLISFIDAAVLLKKSYKST